MAGITLPPEGYRFEMFRIQQLRRPFGFEKVEKVIEQTLASKKREAMATSPPSVLLE